MASQAGLVDSEGEAGGMDMVVEESVQGVGKVVVGVAKAVGKKCERCWNYSEHVGEDSEHPHLCERCVDVVRDDFPDVKPGVEMAEATV